VARGVDTAAHRGAIAVKGKTVAVFGTVDVLYPKENSRLSEQILSLGGALISEFALGTFAAPQNFPHPQPHHQRHVDRRPGCRDSRIQ
jgi:DNA processing protein